MSSTPTVHRFSVASGFHAECRVTFKEAPPVKMALYVCDGGAGRLLATTDRGIGIRVLSVLAGKQPLELFVSLYCAEATEAVMRISMVHFDSAGDDTLLQLPLPLDDTAGYRIDDRTIFRYQFGVPTLLRLVLQMARERVAGNLPPLLVYDLSQWDGNTPGADYGRPRHNTHRHGLDADISIEDLEGHSQRRSFCDIREEPRGRVCIPNTVREFGGGHTVQNLTICFQSSRVHTVYLDRELIDVVKACARDAAARGEIPDSVLPFFSSPRHLQHWPNHTDHFHLKILATQSIPGR